MMTDIYDDGFGLELDTESVTEEQLHAGRGPTKEGYFHVAVEPDVTLSEKEDKKIRYVEIELRILNGCDMDGVPAPDQVDKILKHKIFVESWVEKSEAGKPRENFDKAPLTPKAATAIKALFYAAGVITAEQLQETKFKPAFPALAGKQFIAKLSRDDNWTDDSGNERSGRIKLAWNNDTYPLGHDRVKDVPIDHVAAAGGGYVLADSPADDVVNSI